MKHVGQGILREDYVRVCGERPRARLASAYARAHRRGCAGGGGREFTNLAAVLEFTQVAGSVKGYGWKITDEQYGPFWELVGIVGYGGQTSRMKKSCMQC